jgi:hypothetical protein
MTVYGIGAYHGDDRDVSNTFLSEEAACVGWSREEAPALHRILKHIKIGDIIYIKVHTPQIGLKIKAVGIVTDDTVSKYSCGYGVKVKWIWTGEVKLGKLEDKCTNLSLTLSD